MNSIKLPHPMPSLLRRIFRHLVLLEAGAALLFFSFLAQQPELARKGEAALQELVGRGYEVPSIDLPVRVYPAQTQGAFTGRHGGGWRPGVISLRELPEDSLGADIFLRHELMHEASHRTCVGLLPLWAEEAAAMRFSGELASSAYLTPFTEAEVSHLRQTVRDGAALLAPDYRTLARLAAAYPPADAACVIPQDLARLLGTPMRDDAWNFSHILVSALSGRVLETGGDMAARYPPGSLLKIPYAAALVTDSLVGLGEELAQSDTERLLSRRQSFSLPRYRLIITPVEGADLLTPLPHDDLLSRGDEFLSRYLGGRNADGTFPLAATLPELALVLRSALLSDPRRFAGLKANGFSEGSTLFGETAEDKMMLKTCRALTKTGSIRDRRGQPLMGHLMVAWPAEEPLYLAIFRQGGMSGAKVLRRAAPLLRRWAEHYPVSSGKVRVRLLPKIDRSFWEVKEECPEFTIAGDDGWRGQVSICGRFGIIAAARGSRPERVVSGVLRFAPEGGAVVLETDPETYTDGVLAAEAQELRGPARQALRAVILWNGIHGRTRHPESASLCDTTHCMVFQGGREDASSANHPAGTDPGLVRLLDDLARERDLDWLAFAKGGDEQWEMTIPAAALRAKLNEPRILDVRRERKKDGQIVIHLLYSESEETVSCEVFRNRLKLLSCPDAIRFTDAEEMWTFQGVGEGHGEGFSLSQAEALSAANRDARSILEDAYALK